jgi:hypothetical protein
MTELDSDPDPGMEVPSCRSNGEATFHSSSKIVAALWKTSLCREPS